MMQESLASRLRLLRVQRGLTLQEASDEIGIDRHTLSSIERGTQRPHAPTLKKIAEGYGVAIENLLAQDDLAEEPVEAPTSPKVEAPTSSEPAEEAEESKERREELLGEEGGVSEGQLLRNVVAIASLAKEFARRWEEEIRARITEGDFPWERSAEIQMAALGLHNVHREERSAYTEASDNVNRGFLAELDKDVWSMFEAAQRVDEVAAALRARHSEEPSAKQASVSEAANRHLRLVYSKTG